MPPEPITFKEWSQELKDLNPRLKNEMFNAEEENQKNTKPCRVDGVTPCVQYPDDDCNCNPCEICEIYLQKKKEKIQ